MRATNYFLLFLLLLSSEVFAATTVSLVHCSTKQGLKPTSTVRTTSAVLTVPLYGFKITTVTPRVTVTPKAYTTTLTDVTTSIRYIPIFKSKSTYCRILMLTSHRSTITLPQETDTFSETATEIITVPETTVRTLSTTTTDTSFTTSTPTSTIASSAAFTPARSSVPNSAKRRGVAGKPANALIENSLEERKAAPKSYCDCKGHCTPQLYPQSVKCGGIVKVIGVSTITRVAAKTRTVTAATPTSTVHTLQTSIVTSTVTPIHASTTLSFTDTSSVTSTETQTTFTTFHETATVQVVAPTATFYAACGPSNIISSINGVGILGGVPGGNSVTSLTKIPSAYDCCVQCLGTTNCGGTLWGTGGYCQLLIQSSGVCTQANQAWGLVTQQGATGGFVSNGNCGHVYAF
jgi:hypothetical protein